MGHAAHHHPGEPRKGDYVIRRPRSTDALGHALRGVYGGLDLPDDMAGLLRRIDDEGRTEH